MKNINSNTQFKSEQDEIKVKGKKHTEENAH